MKYQTFDYDGYKIFTIQTDKFKNCFIEVNFREDVRNLSMAKRNFLNELMQYTSAKYPTKREMKIAQEELYNITYQTAVARVGYNFFSSFSLDLLDPKYIKEENYLEECIKFLSEMILKPDMKDKIWNERSFEIIKERILVSIDNYKEKPTSFAGVDSKNRLFKDSIQSKMIVGSKEEVLEIKKEDLYQEYVDMFANSHCEILVIGNLDMTEVVSLIRKYFKKTSIVLDKIPFEISMKIFPKKDEIVESKYKQTQLLKYYSFDKLTEYEKYYIAPIFRRILSSADMTDKLTTYLREENALCYFCGAVFQVKESYAFLYTGLNYQNVSKALEKMDLAIDEMLKGKIALDYFEKQKEKCLADLKLHEDNMYELIDNYYFHEISGRPTFEDYRNVVSSIKIKDLQAFAKKMHPVYLYILKEGETDGNNRD